METCEVDDVIRYPVDAIKNKICFTTKFIFPNILCFFFLAKEFYGINYCRDNMLDICTLWSYLGLHTYCCKAHYNLYIHIYNIIILNDIYDVQETHQLLCTIIIH